MAREGAFSVQGFDGATELFRAPVRPKKLPSESKGKPSGGGDTGGLQNFIKRVAAVSGKSPEAMVRITGGAKGAHHVKEHLAYITRNGKLEAVDDAGQVIRGKEAVQDLAQQWSYGGTPKAGRAPDTRNLILSMPPGTDPEKVYRAARTFADKQFGGKNEYAMVLHTSEIDSQTKGGHPHVHLTVKTRGVDGRNLNPRKADLQAWREAFAHELRELGVAAEATPRRARGVVKKPQKQAIRHMEQDHRDGKKRKDGTVRPAAAVQLQKYAEAFKELTGRTPPKVRPWELKIADRQQKVRGAWLDTAETLAKHGSPEGKKLADQIRQFVADMPPVQTERQQMHQQIQKSLGRQSDRGPERQ